MKTLIKLLSAIYILSLILEVISAYFFNLRYFKVILLAGSIDILLLMFVLLIFWSYEGDEL